MNLALELIVRGAVLCSLVALSLACLSKSAAAYRHLVCVLALLVFPLLPFRFAPTLHILPARSSATAHVQQPIVEAGPTDQSPASQSAPTFSPEPKLISIPPSPRPSPTQAGRGRSVRTDTRLRAICAKFGLSGSNSAMVLVLIWLIGAGILLLRLVVALVRLHQLKRGSRPAIVQEVSVRISGQVQTPVTWGIRNPVIVLPASLEAIDSAACASALRHEEAHIARWDWAWNLLAELVCIACWFQPGVWWLRKRMRLESETACDERAVLSGISGVDYASHLVSIGRAAAASTVASSMQGKMEQRVRHILNPSGQRHTRTGSLIACAVAATLVLSLAGLRVSARPNGALPPAVDPTASPVASPSVRAAAVINDGTHSRGGPVKSSLLNRAIWGKGKDGLEPGFVITGGTSGTDFRVNQLSKVTYQVLVRNSSNRSQTFAAQCITSDGLEVPYLIPSAAHNAPGNGIGEKYRAEWVTALELGLFPAFLMTLGPGETVVVPGDFALSIGIPDETAYPRVEHPQPGANWILQPVRILRLPDREIAEVMHSKPSKETFFSPTGVKAIRSAYDVPARNGGSLIYAGSQVFVGTKQLAGNPGVTGATWGNVDKGLQCGILWADKRRTFTPGDKIMAQVYYRNTTDVDMNIPLPNSDDLQPVIRSADGTTIKIDFGARAMIKHAPQVLKAHVLQHVGTASIVLDTAHADSPKGTDIEAHTRLAPGTYSLTCYGGVSAVNGGVPQSGAITFTVADTPQRSALSQPVQDDHISWGKVINGWRLGLRLPEGVKSFAKLSQAQFEVLLQNVSDKDGRCNFMGYPTVSQYSPDLYSAKGNVIQFERTIAGPYMDQSEEVATGSMKVLGTLSFPKEEAADLNRWGPAMYIAGFDLPIKSETGVKRGDLNARLAFNVVGR